MGKGIARRVKVIALRILAIGTRNLSQLFFSVILFVLLLAVDCLAQTKTYTAGAYIIDMGQPTQTIANGLKPYGLVYALLKSTIPVPVDWSINSAKAKDEVDFIANSKSYKGGPFIIPSELITPAVLTLITTWRAAGVIIDGPISVGFTAPVYKTLSIWPRAFLDDRNDGLITPYYTNAGIPSSSYQKNSNPTMLPQCGSANGTQDVYILPHADPQDWADGNWIVALQNFIHNGGAMWAGCHAVSAMENIPGCNFLSQNGLVLWGNHSDGTPPYIYADSGNPIMQFIGNLDNASETGSERIYVPGIVGWNNTTTLAIYDSNYSNTDPNPDVAYMFPNAAAVIAYGPAFGDNTKGLIMYEGGHTLSTLGSIAQQVAAQRAFFNFILLAGGQPQTNVMPPTVINQTTTTCSGTSFTVTPSGAPANTTYTWSAPSGSGFTGGSAQTIAQPSISQTLMITTANSATAVYIVTPQIGGCIGNTFTLTVTVNKLPFISVVTASSSICLGSSTILTASGAVTYSWSPSTGLSASTGATVTASPTATTTYTVNGTDASGCANTSPVTLTVNTSNVTVGATPNPVCVGSTLNLSSSITFLSSNILTENFNGATNSWTKINTSMGGTPSLVAWTLRQNGFVANCSGDNKTLHSNDNSQFYQSFSCLQGSGTTATILQSPVMSTIGYNTLTLDFYHFFYFYTGAIATVQVSTDGTNWTNLIVYSTISEGTQSTFAHPSINLNSYIGNATFYIRFKYDAPWSWYWAIDNVTVSGTISSPISWTGPNGFTSASQNPVISNVTTSNAGVYQVTYTDQVTTCSSSNSVTVNVNPLPTITVAPASPAICLGNSITLTASGAVSYSWSPATGLSATIGPTVTANPLTTTTYTVTGTDANGCTNTVVVEVAVISLPVISLTPASATICRGSSTSLTASGAVTFSWSPATGLSAITGAAVIASPVNTTTYTATGTNATGCTNTEIVTVTVIPSPVTTGINICPGGTGSLTSSSTCPPGSSITVGPLNAGIGSSTTAAGGTVAWKTPINAISSGGGNATADLNGPGVKISQYLTTTNYNFSSIPNNAIIVGITVAIGRFESGIGNGNDVKDVGLYLLKAGGIIGNNYADVATEWPKTTLTTATYGGTSDLWGTTWTVAEIQASSFGVSLNASSENDRTASVDYIQISVTYALPGILNWYTASSGGILLGSGTPFNPVGVPNSGLPNTNIAGTYTFYAECSSDNRCRTATNFIINPSPAINAISSSACSGTVFSISPVNITNGAVPTGTTYTWGTPVYSPLGSITGGSAQTAQSTISQTLTNSTNSPATATYTLTPTSGTPALCIGSNFTITVTVNPIPVLSGTLTQPSACSNSLFNYIPSSGTSGTNFSWSRSAITGINPTGPTSGTGSISETLINSTNSPVVVTYLYTLTANGCSNTQNISVVVMPAANVIASASSSTICLGGSTSLSSSSNFLTLPTTILSQNFNSTPAGWISTNLSLGNNPALSNWTLQPDGYTYTDEATTVTFHSNDASQFYLSNSRAQGLQTGPPNPYTETYLTSPMMNITGYSSLSLDYYHCFIYAPTNGGTGAVEISTNGKDWNVLETYSSTQGTSSGFAHRTISLNSYVGSQILQVRFHYNTPARARQWAIDNVLLTGTPSQPAISWTSVPPGFTSAVANPGAVSPVATTVYTATYTDPATNCSGSDTAKVIVNPLPAPTITGPNSVCLNSTGNIYSTESGKSNYSWTINGGTITAGGGSSNNNVTVTWTNAGLNTLTVNYSDANGCTATSPATFQTTANELPSISTAASTTSVCFSSAILTTLLSYSATTGLPTTYSITWNGSPSNSFSPITDAVLNPSPITITVPANTTAGTYSGTITVKNANGCVSLGNTFTVTVNPIPVITTQPHDELDCEERIVSFNVVATGSGLTYIWQRKKPSGNFADIPSEPNVSYPNPGTIRLQYVGNSDAPDGTQYRVVITNSDNCSITSQIATLSVNEIIGITPGATKDTICQGANYSYLVTTSKPLNVVSYQWKKYDSPGLWLPVIDGGVISGATTDNLKFTGATPSQSGDYEVTISFNKTGPDTCKVTSDSRKRKLTVNPTPSCSITGSESVYAGSTGNTYTSSPIPSDNVNHQWSISGNGTISGSNTGTTVSISATSVGTFTLTDNISRFSCISSCSTTISVIDLPCSISPITSVTNGSSTTYTGPAGMDTYTWSISGNGSITSGTTSQTVTVLAGNTCSTYTLTLTIVKSGATTTCTQIITVTDNIAPTFTTPTTFTECVESLNTAIYYGATMDINPNRPDYYTFSHDDTRLDLDTIAFTDNCNFTACHPLQIRWQLDFVPTPDPTPPHTLITKSPETGNGQPSAIVGTIQFPGDGINFTNTIHSITYWIKDCAGNESLPLTQTITIKPRPNIVKGN